MKTWYYLKINNRRLKEINFRSSKFSLLLGAINGFLYAIVFQPVNTAYLAYDYRRMIDRFNGSPPSMIYPITPLAEFLFFTIVFAATSYTVYRFWSAKIKSEVIFWQVIGVVAIVVPSVIFYIFDQLDMLWGLIRYKFESGKWGYYSGIMPYEDNIEFAVLLLCLAITVNFFYGAILSKLSEHFAKSWYSINEKNAERK